MDSYKPQDNKHNQYSKKLTSFNSDKNFFREIDSIHIQIKKLKADLFNYKYGINKEEDYYQNLIKNSTPVEFVLENNIVLQAIIQEHFRYCLIICVEGKEYLLQKSAIILIKKSN